MTPESGKDHEILAAPLQGHTDAAWRAAHHTVYGHSIDRYYSPFVRVEKSAPRARDLRDTLPSDGTPAVPQIIFRDSDEFLLLVNALRTQGHRHIDLNLGCPFPPQVNHGRGAGALRNITLLESIGRYMLAAPDISFSLKMRLGTESPDEWKPAAGAIAAMPLSHVTIHPRTARQQYRGELHLSQFAEAAATIPHPVIFNGDILSASDIARVLALDGVDGVMIGRGLLARPSLAAEWRQQREWARAERINALMQLHAQVFETRAARLCGEAQVLSAMRPFWEYSECEIGRKAWKALRKAGNLRAYNEAVGMISKF